MSQGTKVSLHILAFGFGLSLAFVVNPLLPL
jgi:hypothetical protein